MTSANEIIGIMQTDPELLPGVPSNQQIIEEDEELKKSRFTDLSPAVRSGYLEMWRFKYVGELIHGLDSELLSRLQDEVYSELLSDELTERRAGPLRFILNSVNSAHPSN